MRYDIIADGSSSGNPGPSGIGWKCYRDNQEIYSQSEPIDDGTNNEAEYKAVITATNWLNGQFRSKEYPYGEVHVHTDSRTVFMQVTGGWRVKEIHLVTLFLKAKEALRNCNAKIHWVKGKTVEKYGVDALAKNAVLIGKIKKKV